MSKNRGHRDFVDDRVRDRGLEGRKKKSFKRAEANTIRNFDIMDPEEIQERWDELEDREHISHKI